MNYDVIVVGAGPNGLSAAIELARNGVSVLLLEANATVGGSARSEQSTLPGFTHDTGSAVHPLGIASPFFSSLPLEEHGLEWIHATAPLAHPLDGGHAVLLQRELSATCESLGNDGAAYRRFVGPFVRDWDVFVKHALDRPTRVPRAPALMVRFGARALATTTRLTARFESEGAMALLAGNAAHAGVPLGNRLGGAVAVTLMAAAHTVGWPFPRGGAGMLSNALASYFRSLGGSIETSVRVTSLADLPASRAVVLGLTDAQVGRVLARTDDERGRVSGCRVRGRTRRWLAAWRYGPGAFKVDWALDAPIPWTNESVRRSGTVHVGGTLSEIDIAEAAPWRGRVAERPFVLLAQPSLFDPSRAPHGKHTAWGYCHVPNSWDGSPAEKQTIVDRMESQIERFAPGFRERILARAVNTPQSLEHWNANLVGGDVNGGALSVEQLLGPARWTRRPWTLSADGVYACSASRPPGGGVHGMVGYHAARAVLRETFGVR
jgi:phytoene dehydrogenase-like protein